MCFFGHFCAYTFLNIYRLQYSIFVSICMYASSSHNLTRKSLTQQTRASALLAQVPSGYLLTDMWLYLDMLFQGRLLKDPKKSKIDMAADEALKLKKLIGGIRALWRNSESGQHPRVTELKGLIKPSPSKKKPQESDSCHELSYLMMIVLHFIKLLGSSFQFLLPLGFD